MEGPLRRRPPRLEDVDEPGSRLMSGPGALPGSLRRNMGDDRVPGKMTLNLNKENSLEELALLPLLPPSLELEGLSQVSKMKPETHFDQMVQKAGEYLAEIRGVISTFRNGERTETVDLDLIHSRSQLYQTLSEVTRIADRLRQFVEETSTRRTCDSAINPRIISTVKYREASLDGLLKAIRDTRRSLQVACEERERKDLLNGWNAFDRSNRIQRDAEELMSGSTERLMNSKRILLETIQSSSGTLTCLATSSQSAQGNDRELHSQTSLISSGRSLLRKYGRRASTDKFLVWLSFIFFGFCAFIIVYRRLF